MSSYAELALKIAGALVVVFIAGVCYEYYVNEVWYDRKAKEMGCGLPVKLMDRPFGISAALWAMKAFLSHDILEELRNWYFSKHHTVLGQLMGTVGIMTDDPENIKVVLATSFKDFSLGQRYPIFFPLLGNGIFTLSGEGWKHSRAMLRPQFSRDQVSHIESIKEHVDILIKRLDEAAAKNEFVDAQVLFHCLTLDTATEFLFGESSNTLNSDNRKVQGPTRAVSGMEFSKAFGDAQDILALRFISAKLYWLVDSPIFRRNADICKNFIDYFVHKALEEPLEKGQESEKYVFIRELTKETRDPVIIRDQAFNILLAGRDTTASTMSFMACYMATYKDVYRKLREAVLNDFGTDGSTITFESLKRCKYLNNVVNEILRLHPIVPVNFRTSIRDTKLPRGGGPNGDQPLFVPKNTLIFYSVYAMQRDPDYWGPDADEFKPDRWDDMGSRTWDFLPFNGGPRICLGQQFALTEIGITWVRLCQTFKDIEVDLKHKSLYRMPMHQRVTASVDGGVMSKWIRA